MHRISEAHRVCTCGCGLASSKQRLRVGPPFVQLRLCGHQVALHERAHERISLEQRSERRLSRRSNCGGARLLLRALPRRAAQQRGPVIISADQRRRRVRRRPRRNAVLVAIHAASVRQRPPRLVRWAQQRIGQKARQRMRALGVLAQRVRRQLQHPPCKHSHKGPQERHEIGGAGIHRRRDALRHQPKMLGAQRPGLALRRRRAWSLNPRA